MSAVLSTSLALCLLFRVDARPQALLRRSGHTNDWQRDGCGRRLGNGGRIGKFIGENRALISPKVSETGSGDVKFAGRRQAEFRKINTVQQAGSATVAAGALGLTVEEAIPLPIRIGILTYMVWSFSEYMFHRYAMHAPINSVGDKYLRSYNRLHMTHHGETNKDMTMREGYNPHGIYFSYKTSFIGFLASVVLLGGTERALGMNDVPFIDTLVSSGLMSIIHGLFWNRFHADSHKVEVEYDDGLPALQALKYDPKNNFLRWLMANHVTHHDIKGVGNFNIVLPGFDHILGTYYEQDQSRN